MTPPIRELHSVGSTGTAARAPRMSDRNNASRPVVDRLIELRCWSAGVVRTSNDAAPKRLLLAGGGAARCSLLRLGKIAPAPDLPECVCGAQIGCSRSPPNITTARGPLPSRAGRRAIHGPAG